ncbi:hypothetical protein FE257_012254 [Aspergillus nanangensis]|uniref:Calcium channel YVC1-like C-terminal transmembrane domain-containing protein n=1 Tax=Aspergillus nanangensis TaxID=2582783 RepID=A0AAD4CG83_ASPNN|nr:hypothetical protein FE257_012254 [Aspergillus nanangensis]
MRSSSCGQNLRLLIYSLADDSHNPHIISALMILKWQYGYEDDSDWGLNESRGYACEYVAWQFLCHLNQRETIEFLLEELTWPSTNTASLTEAERGVSGFGASNNMENSQETLERTPLLLSSSSSLYHFFGGRRRLGNSFSFDGENQGSHHSSHDEYQLDRFSLFFGLNALEIAIIAQAKTFLSQKVVQKVIDSIWKGEIVFWDTLSVHSTKKPQFFNKRTADPYSRLRVPIYRKAFEAAFFVSFLFLYYAVLVERKPTGIGIFETLMYFWIAAFAYEEIGGITDTGILFYQMDFWKIWNLGIIGTGLAFVITILYIGFLTSFTMLARDRLSVRQMSWILVKVFFGTPSGCGAASIAIPGDFGGTISPIFGYGLMLIFVSMTNLLLISSLVSLMSMSLEGVMLHAREEYLFQLACLLQFSLRNGDH